MTELAEPDDTNYSRRRWLIAVLPFILLVSLLRPVLCDSAVRGLYPASPSARLTFYLGTHMPHWLTSSRFPLFVSHKRLARYKRLPVARCRWALDSGAFSELSTHGRWTVTPTSMCRPSDATEMKSAALTGSPRKIGCAAVARRAASH